MGKGHNIYNTRHNKQTRHSSECIFQDADLIISRIDPDRAGLLSFPAFCRGVATLMSSDIEMGPGEKHRASERNECVMSERSKNVNDE